MNSNFKAKGFQRFLNQIKCWIAGTAFKIAKGMFGNAANPRQVTLIDIQRLSPLCNKTSNLLFFHCDEVYHISPPASMADPLEFFIKMQLVQT